MSRIGKNPVSIPAGVELNIDGNVVRKVRRIISRDFWRYYCKDRR
jgi:ribosomal protein L6P/L9E